MWCKYQTVEPPTAISPVALTQATSAETCRAVSLIFLLLHERDYVKKAQCFTLWEGEIIRWNFMVELRIDRNCWYSPPSFPWLIRIPDRCLHNGTSFFRFTLKELVHSFFRDISGCIILLAPEKCAWLATRHIPKTIAGGNTFEHLKSTTACPMCLKQWEKTLIFREILKKCWKLKSFTFQAPTMNLLPQAVDSTSWQFQPPTWI